MTDGPLTAADRLRKLSELGAKAAPASAAPASSAAPAPGFKYGRGDKVIDVIGGERGVVAEFYQSASGQGAVYEVRTGLGRAIVRLERELERDGARNILPRI